VIILATQRSVIYIQLLDEGTAVWRPTEGEMVADMVFKVLPTENYDPEDEHWEFPPGTIVRCKKQIKHNQEAQEVLIAVEKI
jgi:hypothetical protein